MTKKKIAEEKSKELQEAEKLALQEAADKKAEAEEAQKKADLAVKEAADKKDKADKAQGEARTKEVNQKLEAQKAEDDKKAKEEEDEKKMKEYMNKKSFLEDVEPDEKKLPFIATTTFALNDKYNTTIGKGARVFLTANQATQLGGLIIPDSSETFEKR